MASLYDLVENDLIPCAIPEFDPDDYVSDISVQYIVTWENGYETRREIFNDEMCSAEKAFNDALSFAQAVASDGYVPTLMSEPDDVFYDIDTAKPLNEPKPVSSCPVNVAGFETIDPDELPF